MTQSGVTCKLDTSLVLGKHRGHPALPVAPAPRLGGCLQSRVCFAQAVQAASAVTPSPGHPCLFGFFATFHQNKHQTRAPEAEESTAGDTGQCQMSPNSREIPVPDPRASQAWVILGCLGPVAKLTPQSERALPTSLIGSSGISITERD